MKRTGSQILALLLAALLAVSLTGPAAALAGELAEAPPESGEEMSFTAPESVGEPAEETAAEAPQETAEAPAAEAPEEAEAETAVPAEEAPEEAEAETAAPAEEAPQEAEAETAAPAEEAPQERGEETAEISPDTSAVPFDTPALDSEGEASYTLSCLTKPITEPGYAAVYCSLSALTLGIVPTLGGEDPRAESVSFEFYSVDDLDDGAGHSLPFLVAGYDGAAADITAAYDYDFTEANYGFDIYVYVDSADWDAAAPGTYTGALQYRCIWHCEGGTEVLGVIRSVSLTALVSEAGAAHSVIIEEAADGAVIADMASAAAGQTVTLTAVPAPDCALKDLDVYKYAGGVRGDWVRATKVDDTTWTFSMPSADVVVVSSFASIYPLTVGGVRVTGANAADILGDGRVSYDPDTGTLTLSDADITGQGGVAVEVDEWCDLTIRGSGTLRGKVSAPNGQITIDAELLICDTFNGIVTSRLTIAGGTVRINAYTYTVSCRVFNLENGERIREPSDAYFHYEYGTLLRSYSMPVRSVVISDRDVHSISTMLDGGKGTIRVGRYYAAEGDTVTVWVTPDPGYKLTALYGKYYESYQMRIIEPEYDSQADCYTLTMPGDDLYIVHSYEQSWDALQASVDSAEDGGTILLTEDVIAPADAEPLTFAEGTTLTLDLAGHTFDRGLTEAREDGSVLLVNGTLTVTDSVGGGKITGGSTTGAGGGVRVPAGGVFTLLGGSVTGNRAVNGGGIYNAGMVTVSGGAVTNNTASNSGGGLFNNDTGILNLTGGSVTDNSAAANYHGGGVFNSAGGTLNVAGSPVVAGNLRGGMENNIGLYDDSVIHVTGPLDDTALLWVNRARAGSDKSSSGVVTEGLPGRGTAENFRSDESSVDTKGYYNKYIRLNTAGEAMVAMQYLVSFDPNGGTGAMTELTTRDDDCYRTLPECAFTAPAGKLFLGWSVCVNGGDPVIKQPGDFLALRGETVVTALWGTAHAVTFQPGEGGEGGMEALLCLEDTAFALPACEYAPLGERAFAGWSVRIDGAAPVTMQPGDEIPVTGEITLTALWVRTYTWASLQAAINDAPNGAVITLENDVTAGSRDTMLIVEGKSITLDLNGHTLNRNRTTADADGHVIIVRSGAALTLIDSSGDDSGVITGGYANNGGGINNKGMLTIEGGTITGNHVNHADSANRGGAIYNSGTLIMTGGRIVGNDADDAGAIYNDTAGTVELAGVTIADNRSVNHGGGALVNYGTAALTGCVIRGNRAAGGGGGLWTQGVLTVMDCEITGNESSAKGGGIAVAESGTLYLRDSAVTGNTAADGGGLIILKTTGTADISGETAITENTSVTYGGGGITNYGTVAVSGALTVEKNSSKGNGGGLWNGGVLRMRDTVRVTNNTSDVGTNNLYLSADKVITVTGALSGDSLLSVSGQDLPRTVTAGWPRGQSLEVIEYENGMTPYLVNGQVAAYFEYLIRRWNGSAVVEETGIVPESTHAFPSQVSSGGWFVIYEDMTLSNRVELPAGKTVNLVLMNDVTLNCTQGIYVPEGATLNIYGQAGETGTLLARNTDYNAGIGGNDGGKGNGTINIYGGIVKAQGAEVCAGIGTAQSGSSAPITIYGGVVEATGGLYRQGIGFSLSKPGTIIIYGGVVNATGGSEGAGIGGGEECTGSRVEIHGGTVVATGKNHGAGIGGHDGDCPLTILITGGSVTATGGDGAAGIGAGFRGNMTGSLTVSGGTVVAKGGDKAAGIGGGEETLKLGGEGGTVKITGGTVIATAGSGGQAIGHAKNESVSGSVSVYPGAKVTAGSGEKSSNLKNAADRESACRSGYVKIEPCDHPDASYTATVEGHTRQCKYCAAAFAAEAHSLGSQSRSCTVCGYDAGGSTQSGSSARSGGSSGGSSSAVRSNGFGGSGTQGGNSAADTRSVSGGQSAADDASGEPAAPAEAQPGPAEVFGTVAPAAAETPAPPEPNAEESAPEAPEKEDVTTPDAGQGGAETTDAGSPSETGTANGKVGGIAAAAAAVVLVGAGAGFAVIKRKRTGA